MGTGASIAALMAVTQLHYVVSGFPQNAICYPWAVLGNRPLCAKYGVFLGRMGGIASGVSDENLPGAGESKRREKPGRGKEAKEAASLTQ